MLAGLFYGDLRVGAEPEVVAFAVHAVAVNPFACRAGADNEIEAAGIAVAALWEFRDLAVVEHGVLQGKRMKQAERGPKAGPKMGPKGPAINVAVW